MKNSKFGFVFLPLFAVVLLANHAASANISLNASVINFKNSDRAVKNISVTNTGKEPVKVQVKTVHMQNSGLENEKEEPTRNIVVAPGGFELAAGETRNVRIVIKERPQNAEEVYRVRFIPQKSSQTVEQDHGNGVHTRVSILVGMGVLVLVEPEAPAPNLVAVHNGSSVTYTNKGNVTSEVVRTQNCAGGTCEKLEGRRLYPGMEWTMDLPEFMHNQPVNVTVKTSGEFTNLEAPAP